MGKPATSDIIDLYSKRYRYSVELGKEYYELAKRLSPKHDVIILSYVRVRLMFKRQEQLMNFHEALGKALSAMSSEERARLNGNDHGSRGLKK